MKNLQEQQQSAAELLAMLERELMKMGYFMTKPQSLQMMSKMTDDIIKIQGLPGNVRRGLSTTWSVIKYRKNKEIEIGLMYSATFAVRLVMEALTIASQDKCHMGIVNTYAAMLRQSLGIEDRGESMVVARVFLKVGRVLEDLQTALEAVDINQSDVVRTQWITYQYGPYMTKELLPKKDIMAMSLRLALPLIKNLLACGVAKELLQTKTFINTTKEAVV
jgi:hypothetical protein